MHLVFAVAGLLGLAYFAKKVPAVVIGSVAPGEMVKPGGGTINPKPSQPAMCEYPAPPMFHRYVPGANYDAATGCGMELIYEGDAHRDEEVPVFQSPENNVSPFAGNTSSNVNPLQGGSLNPALVPLSIPVDPIVDVYDPEKYKPLDYGLYFGKAEA